VLETKESLSEYSKRFRDIGDEQLKKNREKMANRVEDFRLRLDLEVISPLIKGPDILDFPIGTGRFFPNFIDKYNVFGYDICRPYIHSAQAMYPEIAGNFQVCSFEKITSEKKFDTVVSLRVLPNIENLELATQNVSSILKNHGRWIFTYSPRESRFSDLPAILANAELKIVKRVFYDFHSGQRGMGWIETGLYARFRRAVNSGYVPYFLFRIWEALRGRKGTCLFVVQPVGHESNEK
jgi:2-polyprenyl-3-methyl-5-hydroxy-6-metoxy-1,4-benzoquinol methylase